MVGCYTRQPTAVTYRTTVMLDHHPNRQIEAHFCFFRFLPAFLAACSVARMPRICVRHGPQIVTGGITLLSHLRHCCWVGQTLGSGRFSIRHFSHLALPSTIRRRGAPHLSHPVILVSLSLVAGGDM